MKYFSEQSVKLAIPYAVKIDNTVGVSDAINSVSSSKGATLSAELLTVLDKHLSISQSAQSLMKQVDQYTGGAVTVASNALQSVSNDFTAAKQEKKSADAAVVPPSVD